MVVFAHYYALFPALEQFALGVVMDGTFGREITGTFYALNGTFL